MGLRVRYGLWMGALALLGFVAQGCQSGTPAAPMEGEKGATLNVNQMAPPPPPNADPQQKAMQEFAQQKAREAMSQVRK